MTRFASPSEAGRSAVRERWWVYVLATVRRPRVTYVGATTDPARRLRQHNGLEPGGGAFTRSRRPWRLARVYGPFRGRSEAQRAERAVKRLPGRDRIGRGVAALAAATSGNPPGRGRAARSQWGSRST